MALNETDNDTNFHVKIEFETSDDDFFISKIESLNEGYINEDFNVKEFIKEEPVDYELRIEQPIGNCSLTECLSESIGTTNYKDNRIDSCNTLNEINLTTLKKKFPSNQRCKFTKEEQIRAFECTKCSKKFKTKGNLKEHVTKHCHPKQKGPYICDVCKKEYRKKYLLIKHLRCHTGEIPFPCNECGKKFFNSSYLKAHTKRHTKSKPHHCNMCDKKFRTKRELSLHMQTHTGKINACNLCDKKYCRKYSLNEHMRTHTGERPFSCHICQKKFINKSNLDQHLRTNMHSNSTLAKHKKPRIRRPITKKCVLTEENTKTHFSVDFESSVVQAHTTSETALHENIPAQSNEIMVDVIENNTKCYVKQEPIPIEGLVIKTEPVLCEEEYVINKNECLKSEEDFVYIKKEFVKDESIESGWPVNKPLKYNSASDSLLSEIIETSDAFTCDVCNRKCNSRRNLRRHKTVHSERSSYICDICKQRFLEKNYLLAHMRIHTGERPFACSKCDKKFRQRGALTKHRKTHTGQKPFSCQICDKKFSLNYSLQVHARIHTGERPYACDKCEKTFQFKSGINRHKKYVHK